jgi:hypothetical protein
MLPEGNEPKGSLEDWYQGHRGSCIQFHKKGIENRRRQWDEAARVEVKE